jgi:hypothetical protein
VTDHLLSPIASQAAPVMLGMSSLGSPSSPVREPQSPTAHPAGVVGDAHCGVSAISLMMRELGFCRDCQSFLPV